MDNVKKTHDIAVLYEECRPFLENVNFELTLEQQERITSYAVDFRYPDGEADFDESDSEFAIRRAKELLDKTEMIIKMSMK